MRACCVIAASLAALSTGSGAEARPRFAMSAGLDWSTGHYGEAEATTILSAPITFKIASGRWSVAATGGPVLIDGPAEAAAIEGGGSVDAAPARRAAQAGPGDTFLAVGYTVPAIGRTPLYATVVAKTRLPTGDRSRGLGVGAQDYMLGAELGARIGRGGASATLTRRFLGDTSAYARHDGWQIEAGGWFAATGRLLVGGDYLRRASPFRHGTAVQELDAYLEQGLSSRLRLQLTGTVGLSRTAAARGLAFRLASRF